MNRTIPTKGRGGPAVSDDYLEMILEFPLRPLRTAREHAVAQEILDRMIGRDDLTAGRRDYLAGLVRFVEDFEREQTARKLGGLRPLELLKHLIEENQMSTTDLGHVLGSRGLASEVLNGKRGLSKALISKLSRRFGIDAGLFLGA